MAFYGSNYGDDNVGEYHWTPYSTNPYDSYAVLPSDQSALPFSAYEFNEPIQYDYSPYNHFDSYSSLTQSFQNYYACNLSEPRLFQYDPPPSYAVQSFYSQTSYSTYYSNSEVKPESDVIEFEEYDPTPYGGGYDPHQTYGKPLPPSDEICYPRSSPVPTKPDGELSDGFSYGSFTPAHGGKTEVPPKPVTPKEQDSKEEKIAKETGNSGNIEIPEEPSMQEEDRGGDVAEHSAAPDNGGNEGYGNSEWNKQVPYHVPYGSGLESLDICESLFGYWPCLAKMERQKKACQVCDHEETRYDPWKSTADYLFGSSYSYGDYQGSSYQHQNLYAQYQH
ncbi:OLC1v1021835C1 [Oldenlandia corymbosa var. corymbosa]|uniref:OLC1v1021835C1 n=1 Tax=Oldenlandia corymbosa var. corymbosa TaxID=529605 RepID=A0AAV1BXW1_OLDCO|nr:OLC1v1021835C1 [Oldenlandia corymbosa var. corymbosa]